MDPNTSVTLTRLDGYRFEIDFGAGLPAVTGDEPAPLGQGEGPTPNHLLLAAVANCLAVSLQFALQKFKQDPGELRAIATLRPGRNERGRLRVQGVDVQLELGRPGTELTHLDRVLAQFEDFCTVSQSVKEGIDVRVAVRDIQGTELKPLIAVAQPG